ncbi:hypothetical protein QVD17_35995 [Tagetes erecta]|uniref:Jacalin-like lectin domain-containing protein n=1 Tax=Tagetes erecta TaxID=13708 RepID=A0AAD8JTW8_TARER|nr:hypothetical protein QVD17_35995 [Tagetes erecta]
MSLVQELDHLKIPLEHIKLATNNFSNDNFIGQGGFGRVYKGQLPLSTTSFDNPATTVAVKRLDVKGGQGQHEFLMEIVMLASYKHDNLVSLLGFSDDGHEKLLVYKHEVNGSLDIHLSSTNLTWEQRLKICVGAAKGFEYLHNGVSAGHKVLHRDIKSSNILLDANWVAKISDFGLCTIGPTNQQFTFLVTNACGTFGYVDPQYVSTGVLTKESDVYSFGVVLFEVICGRYAMIKNCEEERRLLSRFVKFHKQKGTLDTIIMPHLLEQMEPYSLQVFSNIAFQCLNEDRKQRPTMGLIVKDLETALKYQLVTQTTVSEPEFGRRTKLWGSMTGGSPFLFKLESDEKLRKITIYHDMWINSLIFTTQDSNGLLHTSQEFGGLHNRRQWEEMFVMDLDADEEITGISGTYGRNGSDVELIMSLSFVTNKETYGPFGKSNTKSTYANFSELRRTTNTHFSESWDSGLFDGFYGRCGWFVDALGCCLKTIN